jgi:hypothetical protein
LRYFVLAITGFNIDAVKVKNKFTLSLKLLLPRKFATLMRSRKYELYLQQQQKYQAAVAFEKKVARASERIYWASRAKLLLLEI